MCTKYQLPTRRRAPGNQWSLSLLSIVLPTKWMTAVPHTRYSKYKWKYKLKNHLQSSIYLCALKITAIFIMLLFYTIIYFISYYYLLILFIVKEFSFLLCPWFSLLRPLFFFGKISAAILQIFWSLDSIHSKITSSLL